MLKKLRYSLYIGIVIMFSLFVGCSQLNVKKDKSTTLEGYVVSLIPMKEANVTVYDLLGNSIESKTNKKGKYSIDIEGLKAPLLISAVEKDHSNINDNSNLRGKAVAALISDIKVGEKNIANVNPISDKVVSDVATTLSFKGPVGLIERGNTEGITSEIVNEKTEKALVLIKQALIDAGVKSVDTYSPVTTPMTDAIFNVMELIRHNRSYHTKTGKVSGTLLFDLTFHPLSNADYLDYKKGLEDKRKFADKNITRIFLAGDSTVSNYESEKAPRQGWGQAFNSVFKDDANVMIINAAMSGRSSRSYINEGWLRMYEDLIKPGDYLFIQFGHNDEKAGSNPPKARDVFDLKNTATFPNDINGNVQGEDNMSFERWLEKYINVAKSKKATPILVTPITRINRASDKKTGIFPIETSTHIVLREKSSGKYVGDYSQTVRDTAKANNINFIDLDKRTIEFANSIGEPEWKNYWLGVDPAKYPYYKKGKTGNINKPDGTHVQRNGALKISGFVSEEIKKQDNLLELSKFLK